MCAHWESIYRSLERLTRNHIFEGEYEMLRSRYETLGPFRSPRALVSFLVSRDGSPHDKNAIIRSLVAAAQSANSQTTATALLWLGLWPGLDSIFGRRARGYADGADELAGVLSESFMELVRGVDLARVRRLAATLVRSTERAIIDEQRALWIEQAWLADECDDEDDEDQELHVAEPPDHSSLGIPTGFCFDAQTELLREQLLPLLGDDAELIIAVAVLDETQREAGERLGLSHQTARKRYRRRLDRMRRHLPTLAHRSAKAVDRTPNKIAVDPHCEHGRIDRMRALRSRKTDRQ